MQSRGTLLLIGALLGFGLASCRNQSGGDATCCSLLSTPPVAVPSAAIPDLDEETITRALDNGRAIAAEAQKELGSRLMRAVGEGGFTNALEVCSVEALPLTRLVADRNGVTIARVSHKARNPLDKATPEEMDLIRSFQTLLEEQSEPLIPVVQSGDAATVRFYAPILINNPLCLNCHGTEESDIQSATLSTIRRLYPEDQATGFKYGDLRGLWRIDIPRESLFAER